MNNFIKGLQYGISYFTIFPTNLKKFDANNSFYKGVVFSLPLSGLILAFFTIFLFFILPFNELYKAIFCAIIYPFLYGFLHLEAVADTIDGYFASLGGKESYEVMKEPQIGSIGALGTFCFILLLILALSYLLYNEEFISIILAFSLSRLSVWFALELEFHKKSVFINMLKENFKLPTFLKIVLYPLSLYTKFLLIAMKKHFGFLNGDILGTHIVFLELLILNIGVIIAS